MNNKIDAWGNWDSGPSFKYGDRVRIKIPKDKVKVTGPHHQSKLSINEMIDGFHCCDEHYPSKNPMGYEELPYAAELRASLLVGS